VAGAVGSPTVVGAIQDVSGSKPQGGTHSAGVLLTAALFDHPGH
jgi:hypothetical protein